MESISIHDQSESKVESHAVQAAASSNNFKYIPQMDGARVLNLDLSSFVKKIPGNPVQKMLLSTQTKANTPGDILESINFCHASVHQVLSTRLGNIKQVRDIWKEDAIKPSIEHLLKLRDSSAFVDVLRILVLKPSLITLDVAVELLPMVSELLFEVFEEYACVLTLAICFWLAKPSFCFADHFQT
jgi:katanin p80 WD40 repeat-containing subunit B1